MDRCVIILVNRYKCKAKIRYFKILSILGCYLRRIVTKPWEKVCEKKLFMRNSDEKGLYGIVLLIFVSAQNSFCLFLPETPQAFNVSCCKQKLE